MSLCARCAPSAIACASCAGSMKFVPESGSAQISLTLDPVDSRKDTSSWISFGFTRIANPKEPDGGGALNRRR